MRFKEIKFNRLISDKKIFENSLKKTKEFYRPHDPGQYLYNLMLEKRKKIDIFSDEYLELIYTTLIAWNMNGRMRYIKNKNRGGQSFFYFFRGGAFLFLFF